MEPGQFCSRLFKAEAHYQDFLTLVEESLNFAGLAQTPRRLESAFPPVLQM